MTESIVPLIKARLILLMIMRNLMKTHYTTKTSLGKKLQILKQFQQAEPFSQMWKVTLPANMMKTCSEPKV